MAIAGSDYVALELATLFQRLGVGVTLLAAGPILAGMEAPVVQAVSRGLRELGVDIRLDSKPSSFETGQARHPGREGR